MTSAVRLLASVSLLAVFTTVRAADPTFFAQLRTRAKALAAEAYAPPQGQVPEWLRQLSYDELRQIEFEGNRSLWKREQLPFQVQFLHPGFLYDQTVRLFELQESREQPIPFLREYFNYRTAKAGTMPATMGFAGFRLMFPFGGRDQPFREVGSFVGASYFRFLSADTAYGLSARGLALNTVEPDGEEFPRFTAFWLEPPKAKSEFMVLYALLEGPSVAGAYQFTVTPGASTVVQIRGSVFPRKESKVFGIAPLTSMYWHGENSNSPTRDFRPEVHDSDGLLIHNGADEWIWRPLANPRGVRVSSFADENPRAFGLIQRDRDFENYQDLEASYHSRPSAWVEPVGRWGKGSVRLVEIPTATEFEDNIVVFWVPEKTPAAGESVDFEYRLHWFLDPIGPPAGVVRSTRHGKSAYYEPGLERFVVDFDGPQLQALQAGAPVDHEVSVGDGATLNHSSLQKNAINGTWRVAFTIKPDGSGRPVELRCFLRKPTETLTETWSYLWQP